MILNIKTYLDLSMDIGQKEKQILADNVRRLRRGANLKQHELTEKIGLTKHSSQIGNIETMRPESNPGLLTLAKIAHALGVSTFELLTPFGTEPFNPNSLEEENEQLKNPEI